MNMLRPSLATFVFIAAAAFLFGCNNEDGADAHGTFEAEEVTMSSEVGGQLLRFSVEAGDRLPAGPFGGAVDSRDTVRRGVVGLVDTSRLALQRRELRARRQSIRSKRERIAAEIEVLAEQLRAARRELERARTLREGGAAPERQVDRARDEVRVLERRIEATRTQTASLTNEIEAVNEQIAQVDERIQKSWVVNPIEGTVLTTYAEKGEVVRIGEPLYTVAALDTLTLRAYVSGAQLSTVRLGQRAQVFFDVGPEDQEARAGRVTWIADEAEFTPTPIQTKEERVDLVYAVEIRVPNSDGALKIGMPADVRFGSDRAGASTDTTMAELR